ncbi:hypothetical protein [Mammaliicoccus sciuri]|uniref:hypothetical protein n=1 Tax=Mammaliicoccus sciuri TaxID=1296 RepID=UPI0021CF5790|nr:hypothetical protein [Mammaliicoccus sciuri]UXU70121.1 hypothetical protein MUA36_05430 [Mammaliicoccus sciuri]WQL34243.1 hypothetical protein P3U41_05600 [Mammaliicoccus sciuri]WQL61182.1 hypothetical protein P3T96_05600 [Mammaliicoccus sciuri]
MKSYTFDDIKEFQFDDSRSYRRTKEKGQYINYSKHIETVTFNDDVTGYYVSVQRQVHDNDFYDSLQSETVVKQKIFLDEKKADNYFMSDRK